MNSDLVGKNYSFHVELHQVSTFISPGAGCSKASIHSKSNDFIRKIVLILNYCRLTLIKHGCLHLVV